MRPCARDTCGGMLACLAAVVLLSTVPGGEAFSCPVAVKGAASRRGGSAAARDALKQQRLATR